MTRESKDRVTVGVNPVAAAHLEAVMGTGWFLEEVDAYRASIALAIQLELSPPATLSGVQTKYNVGTLDPDGKVASLIRLLAPASGDRPYEYGERLADVGLQVLRARLVDDDRLLSSALDLDLPDP